MYLEAEADGNHQITRLKNSAALRRVAAAVNSSRQHFTIDGSQRTSPAASSQIFFFVLSLIFALNSIRHFEENFPSTLANPIELHTTNDHTKCCTSAYLTLSKSSGSLMNVLKC